MIRLLVAIDEKRGLANELGIPWQGKVPSDSKFFANQTMNGIVLMGYRTYEEFSKPLHDRQNFVEVRAGTPPLRSGFNAVENVPSFLEEHSHEIVWVIGGAGLFAQTIQFADELYITQLEGDFHCTKFFPPYHEAFTLATHSQPLTENGITYRFETWKPTRG